MSAQACLPGKAKKSLRRTLKPGMGYKIGKNLLKSDKIRIEIDKDPNIKEELLLDGTGVAGMGCIAGGLRFMASYPMTPASELQVFISNTVKSLT